MSNVDLNSLEAVSVEGDTDEMVFVKIHAFSRFAGMIPTLMLLLR